MIGAPLFIVSNPSLVIAQCTSGIVGSFPALNARPASKLDEWIHEITEALAGWDRDHPDRPAAPFAVNQIVHRSNDRFEQDMEVCAKWKVPIVITSLGARVELNEAVHGWGGITLHDVIDDRFARKAIEKGADGIIAVAAGAGGHAGRWSPFALIQEIRAWFDGPLILSGAIANGASVLAAQAAGADLAYVGSPFIATEEANASEAYKQAIVDSGAADIVYSDLFTGVHGNYLRSSIVNAGLDPDNLAGVDPTAMKFGSEGSAKSKAWRDIWGSGQGIGVIDRVRPAAEFIDLSGRAICRGQRRGCAAPDLGLAAAEPALEATHQRPRRTLRHDRFQAAFVDALDPRVKLGARSDQLARCRRKLVDDGRIALLRIAEPPFGAAAFARRDLARLDRALRQQPGDDVHDPRRHLQRFAGKADARERLQHRPLITPRIVEIGSRFVGEQHRLGVERVDKARRDAHLRLRPV